MALSFQDQVARGQKLEWQIVTQSATLEGDACEVTSPEFRLTGQKLVLYRLDSRFDVKGPGTLYWGAPAQPDPPKPAAPAPAADAKASGPRAQGSRAAVAAAPVGILTLGKDNKVTVKWQTSMSYDVDAAYATFAGSVVAQQTDSSLKCDQLKINFRQGSSNIDSVVATGNVSVRDVNATSGRDILCQELTWNAGADTVELTAVKGQTVTITQGPQTISSSHLVLDNAQGALDCPAPGRLTMAPAGAEEGADPGDRFLAAVHALRPAAQAPGQLQRRRGRPARGRVPEGRQPGHRLRREDEPAEGHGTEGRRHRGALQLGPLPERPGSAAPAAAAGPPPWPPQPATAASGSSPATPSPSSRRARPSRPTRRAR